jgi:hypothetical protein
VVIVVLAELVNTVTSVGGARGHSWMSLLEVLIWQHRRGYGEVRDTRTKRLLLMKNVECVSSSGSDKTACVMIFLQGIETERK